jgi:desulfoferrodoxin-like iron-binding protein
MEIDWGKSANIGIVKGGSIVAVEKTGEKYRCNICGNEVIVTKVGGGTLVCCGEDMEKIE